MKASDLSKVSLQDLYDEIAKRADNKLEGELFEIKALFKKKKLVGACQYYETGPGGYGPYFILGISKKGKFKDFYYNSGMEYEKFNELIPSCFAEAMESTYEFHPPKGVKKDINTAIEFLKKAGYTEFEDKTGEDGYE